MSLLDLSSERLWKPDGSYDTAKPADLATLLPAYVMKSLTVKSLNEVTWLRLNGNNLTEPGLEVPDGLRLVYLPRYSPQLQPAECLWSMLDEPIANKYFETIEALDVVVAEFCCTLETSPDLFKGRTNFHWWPKTYRPN